MAAVLTTSAPERVSVPCRPPGASGHAALSPATGAVGSGLRRWPARSNYAEDHQQYLAKVPNGDRCHANTGVKFPADA